MEFVECDVGEKFSVIVQRILLAPKTTKQSKKHIIFRTSCTISKEFFGVIVDNGSSENLITSYPVKAMGLSTENQPKPTNLGG